MRCCCCCCWPFLRATQALLLVCMPCAMEARQLDTSCRRGSGTLLSETLLCSMLRKPPFSRVTHSTVFLGTHTQSVVEPVMGSEATKATCAPRSL
ncbi:hypothetical protein COO60DRAFT_1608479 [Scenedesmus sp. NREL 46B-D3]|nr:hypothetical protein COO60DRAFT_1608479 [Scenedesmus sp. NREL 46B-D3]